ncbi:MAG: SNF2-related protein, partial [Candidatus Dormibacteria bacterium]
MPEPYQLRGSAFLCERGAAVLWLDPGMRKTSIVLHAFDTLRAAGSARKMLVIAPKRVCELVWRQEGAKWEEFRHLRFVFLHGPKKTARLAEDADVYLINPEGVMWLAKQLARASAWPFDTIVFDEITKFKNSQSERSKALRGRVVGGIKLPNLLARAERRWGMTGTPSANGYMDLFGQFLVLDDGAALGRFITHYRDTFFSVGYNGFDYTLQPGAEKRIQERLEPYVFSLDSADYLTLPDLQDNIIEIELEGSARTAYDAMRKDMVAQFPDGVIEAANTAAAYTKLSQMAGGAVYRPDGSVEEIHAAKLDALADLIDELQGQQLLVAYEFRHEKDRMQARFGERMAFLSDASTG